jgi:hypothetical protein
MSEPPGQARWGHVRASGKSPVGLVTGCSWQVAVAIQTNCTSFRISAFRLGPDVGGDSCRLATPPTGLAPVDSGLCTTSNVWVFQAEQGTSKKGGW